MKEPNRTVDGGRSGLWTYALFIGIGALLYVVVAFLIAGLPGRMGEADDVAAFGVGDDWEAYAGELPFRDGVPEDRAVAWRPLAELQAEHGKREAPEPYWLRIVLPGETGGSRDPYLWVKRQSHYQLYVDGVKLGEVDNDGADRFMHPSFGWRSYEMQPKDGPRTLLVHVDPVRPSLYVGSYAVGDGKTLLAEMIRYDAVGLLYVLLFGLLGFASTALYLRSPRDPYYLSFAIITYCAAAGYLFRSYSFQLLPHAPVLVYLADLPGIAATGAFQLFMHQFAGGRRHSLFRVLAAYFFVGAFALTVIALMTDFRTYYRLYTVFLLPGLTVSGVAVVLFAVRRYWKLADRETGWMLTGILSAVLCVVVHIGGSFYVKSLRVFPLHSTTEAYIVENAAGYGVLLFVLALGMAMLTRISRIRAEHRTFTESLERMVEDRTAELAESNRLLEISIRERSEAMAEMYVLEERNRIAGDIHDGVGHSLTTSLVQMDAARLLLKKGREEEGLRKLELSVELVRKSLQDVRESVHMMKSIGAEFDLEESLSELAKATEEAAGIEVTGEVSALPALGTLQKKVVFRTMQEGLTNGLRHGGAGKFRYELAYADGRVTFTLWNDGKPHGDRPFGFGLSSMRERVRQIGGTLEVSSPGGDDYLLSIRFPAG
ncbi:sensor histidine kinase [Paenibacillus flagellatus]|uniref:histidine kinase n=1 Tax=Paenibacillus flagellatus TaxID=2211139 RepID=A0A2V5KS67_9BACL|nr:sensor histidine kinase [Paenibacillus flagellatus]PYI51816.1 sensor histidine kinase [Paenibacillus flagellatus]